MDKKNLIGLYVLTKSFERCLNTFTNHGWGNTFEENNSSFWQNDFWFILWEMIGWENLEKNENKHYIQNAIANHAATRTDLEKIRIPTFLLFCFSVCFSAFFSV